MKRELRVKNYLRYADDFALIDCRKKYLEKLLPLIDNFLKNNLKLNLHPEKVFFKKWHSGVDWLGYNIFSYHIILRTKTKKRMLRKMALKKDELRRGIISVEKFSQSLNSYLGVLKHCRGRGLRRAMFA